MRVPCQRVRREGGGAFWALGRDFVGVESDGCHTPRPIGVAFFFAIFAPVVSVLFLAGKAAGQWWRKSGAQPEAHAATSEAAAAFIQYGANQLARPTR